MGLCVDVVAAPAIELTIVATPAWDVVHAGAQWSAPVIAGWLLTDLGWRALKAAREWFDNTDGIVFRIPRARS
ncbi:hypothetical protein [Nocardia sp. NPDC050710]|uniref:hypothetical protein n=1 Tax=Nocardia sp. NPDC050710 TaxID=3157220 RepID=UPI0033C00088